MQNFKNYLKNISENNNLFLPSIFLSISFLGLALLITNAINNFTNKGETITVTGSAERLVESDTVNWNVILSSRGYGAGAGVSASQSIEKQREALSIFLKNNGIKEEEISFSANSSTPICNLNKDGYENCSLGQIGQIISQNISIESTDVYKIDKLTKDVSTVPSLEVQSSNVRYLYNELKNIRKSMLVEATENAKDRADAVAKAGGARVSKIVSLSSGVFQVTPKNDISAEDYGAYDTSIIEKKVTATVRADFSLR